MNSDINRSIIDHPFCIRQILEVRKISVPKKDKVNGERST